MSSLLTTKMAAELLGLNYKTFHVWNKEGILRPIILENGGWRYDKDLLVEFYEQFCKSKKNAKRTINDAIAIAKAQNGQCLSSEYTDNKSKLSFKCKEGHIFSASFNSVSSVNTWCHECDRVSRAKYSISDCIQYAVGRGECLSAKYGGKLSWKCNCGYIWKSYFANMIRTGSWCRKCAGLATHTIEDCQAAAIKNEGICISSVYKNGDTPMEWRCKNNHTWSSRFATVNSGSWCKRCKDNSLKSSIQDAIDLAIKNNGKCLSLEYINSHTKMEWECHNGHQWEARYYCVKAGNWCPDCSNQISAAQKEIYAVLIGQYPNIPCILNATKVIAPFDLDIYFPSLNIAIEYDGDYWHFSEKAIKRGSLVRMEKKDKICLSKGIALLRIKESDYQQDKSNQFNVIHKFIGDQCQKNEL